MLDQPPASPRAHCRALPVLAGLSALTLIAGQSSALPRVDAGAVPGFFLVQDPLHPAPEQEAQAQFAELNAAMEAMRAKLEELLVAAEAQIQTLQQGNERLAGELEQAMTRATELEGSNERAEARIAELTRAAEEAAREAARLDEALAGQVQRNAELDQELARANTAREAATAEIERIRGEMATKLRTALDAAEQSNAELADLRQELGDTRKELATAKSSAREQIDARVVALEERVERAAADAERLETELAAAKEQLRQATGAAIQAERARQAASDEAEALRSKAARARTQLTAANTEIERVKAANAELEKQIASFHTQSRSAVEVARENLIIMEEKFEELDAALHMAEPEEAASATAEQAASALAKEESSREIRAPSATASPSAPERGGGTGAGKPAAEPELSDTELSMLAPTERSSGVEGSGLTRFRANVEGLNERALEVAGVDLFSGVEALADGVVQISTTAIWNQISPAGQRSYLDSLLHSWAAAQDEEGPAVVRIVDSSGRVLMERSKP